MKKILIIIMSISLVLSVPIITYGAVNNLGDPSANTDTKFTIEPEKTYFEGHVDLLSNLLDPDYGLELYLNDQTFADFNSFFHEGYRNTYIRGSFLTDYQCKREIPIIDIKKVKHY